jgi:SAM-dependent MidA family methyltransferase
MRPPEAGSERIGWSGDFYTSSDVHPILGQGLARQARQIDTLLGHPDPFTVIEMGPGKGLLARDLLRTLLQEHDSLAQRIRLILVERSPAMRELQRKHLHEWLNAGLVTWVENLDSVASAGVTGLLFSNELPDAFPVHRIQIVQGRAQEIYVDYVDGAFVERLQRPSIPDLQTHLDGLNIPLPEGYRTEVNLQALQWMKTVACAMDRGVVITIDYGHTAQDLYNAERSDGTLLCYYSQLTSEDPYQRVGEQDMTAHVDFSSLALAGEDHGLRVTGFTNQMSFLMGLGVEEMIAGLEPESPAFRAAIHLLRPEGMGRTFKVLVQHKGLEQPDLDGLRYKPFFGDVLATRSAA